MRHTPAPLTYELSNEFSGDNWLVASVDFGDVEDDDGPFRHIEGFITKDYVRASDFDLGDPEADLRLWSKSPELLSLLREVIAYNRGEGVYNFSELEERDRMSEAQEAWENLSERIMTTLSSVEVPVS